MARWEDARHGASRSKINLRKLPPILFAFAGFGLIAAVQADKAALSKPSKDPPDWSAHGGEEGSQNSSGLMKAAVDFDKKLDEAGVSSTLLTVDG